MSLSSARFIVKRGDSHYKVRGTDLAFKVQDGDRFIVNREGENFKYTFDWTSYQQDIKDTDSLVCVEDELFKVSGKSFKGLFAFKVVTRPVISWNDELRVASVGSDTVVAGGVKPYSYSNIWSESIIDRIVISDIPEAGDYPLLSLTNNVNFFVSYSPESVTTSTKSKYVTSLDRGQNWIHTDTINQSVTKGGKFFNGKFYACPAVNNSGNGLFFMESDDGINWRKIYVATGNPGGWRLFNIAFSVEQNLAVAVAIGHVHVCPIDEMENPTSWRRIMPINNDGFGGNKYLRDVIYDKGSKTWYLISHEGYLAKSTDGYEWEWILDVPSGGWNAARLVADDVYIYAHKYESIGNYRINKKTLQVDGLPKEYYFNDVDQQKIFRVKRGQPVYVKYYDEDDGSWIKASQNTLDFSGDNAINGCITTEAGNWIFTMRDEIYVKIPSNTGTGDTFHSPDGSEVNLTQNIQDATYANVYSTTSIDVRP